MIFFTLFIGTVHVTSSIVIPEMKVGTRLTWTVEKYPPAYPANEIDAVISRGFGMWTKVCNVNFKQVWRDPDIIIKFVSREEHVLTCGEYWVAGDALVSQSPAQIHIKTNDVLSYNWWLDDDVSTKQHYPLSQLMAHEVGHILGFSNNNNSASIMFRTQTAIPEMHPDDIAECRTRYGSRPPAHSACPVSFKTAAYPPGDPDRVHPVCSRIFSESHCDTTEGASWWFLAINKYPDLRNTDVPSNESWSNRISSFEITPGCTIELCTETEYSGRCLEVDGGLYGKNVATLNETFDNNITSLSCTCGQGTDRNVTALSYVGSVSWSALSKVIRGKFHWQRGAPVPAKFSGYNATIIKYYTPEKESDHSCAVLVEQFSEYGRNILLHHGTMAGTTTSLDNFGGYTPNAFTYVATRPNCTLTFCQQPHFKGLCENVTSDQPLSRDFIFIKSVQCYCSNVEY